MTLRHTLLIALVFIAACGGDERPQASDDTAQPGYLAGDDNPSAGDILPMPFRVIWEPWQGDFDGMVDRRVIRAVVPFWSTWPVE